MGSCGLLASDSGIQAGESLAKLIRAGLCHCLAESESELLLSFTELCEDGVDKIADRWELVVNADPAEIGIQGRRHHLDDLDIPALQQMPEGQRKGMKKGLGCRIDGHLRQRSEGEAGRDVHDCRQGWKTEEQGREVERGFDIDGDLLLGLPEEIFIENGHPVLDACVVDEDI